MGAKNRVRYRINCKLTTAGFAPSIFFCGWRLASLERAVQPVPAGDSLASRSVVELGGIFDKDVEIAAQDDVGRKSLNRLGANPFHDEPVHGLECQASLGQGSLI